GFLADFSPAYSNQPGSEPIISAHALAQVLAIIAPSAGRSCWISNPTKQKPNLAFVSTVFLLIPTAPAVRSIEPVPGLRVRSAEAYVLCGRSPPKLTSRT